MGAEVSHADQKTARMAINLEWVCSWTIKQDPTQQGKQKNTFIDWNGRDSITQPTDPILPHQTFIFFLHGSQQNLDVTSVAMKSCSRL
ncbi:hypothetical protein AVEN_243065-1 [Araneus ventricosus]|uniref:Uncharacterized protein n=1 Tax=Araneus ventricosus TaxID=182803 RepID=A0A4Y2P7T4_ARAVE|nr:hypothetical protein AVEN_243065-1 [Araneus ventricosus]